MSKIDELKKILHHHNHRYYVLDDPEINDGEYDELFRKLSALEDKSPDLVTPDSPTQRVGASPSDKFKKVKHTKRMLSLANAMNVDELIAFDTRLKKDLKLSDTEIEYIVEPKLDGFSVELVYENNFFSLGSTRGDGDIGEDVTNNLKTVRSIPLVLNDNIIERFEIRGEVVMEKKEFEQLNELRSEAGEQLFANPRNSAAGSIRQLDPKVTSIRNLKAYFYGLGTVSDGSFKKHEDILKYINKIGFKTTEYKKCNTIEESIDECRRLEMLRNDFAFEIDGAVVKINDLSTQAKLGDRSRNPRWAIAYKFAPQEATTKINDIVLQVGRTGVLTPVAELEPVNVSGVEIKRATLHNFDEINKKDIRIGDTVILHRAGDVIPKIIKVVEAKRNGSEIRFNMPEKCLICDSKLIKKKKEIAYRCLNSKCPAVTKEKIKHFVSRRAMDIEGFGEKLVDQMVDNNILKDVSDIYYITPERLKSLDRVGQKTLNNLFNSINKSKEQDFGTLIYALGIRHVGESTSKALIETYVNIDMIITADKEGLTSINDIGPEAAESILDFISDVQNRMILNRLKEAGLKMDIDLSFTDRPLQGMKFIFTGTLSYYSRVSAKKRVEDLGGRTVSSISKNLDFVVAGENAGAKLVKAEKLGIKIINEIEFKKLVQD